MDEDGQLPERLRNVEPKLVAQICNEILTRDTRITWDDIGELVATCMEFRFKGQLLRLQGILLVANFGVKMRELISRVLLPVHIAAGLQHAKDCITETIIWPLKRPDLFSGTRAPPKGLLLFGPPVSADLHAPAEH